MFAAAALLAAATALTSAAPHEWAVAYQHVENVGGRAVFNVWNPFVEQPGEFSLGQLWLIGGSSKGQETLEAGWHVFPNLYGDTRTHFFIYSTIAGQPGGCYNLDCGRFVQTSSSSILGAPLACTSVDGGPQCEVAIEFARSASGDWWLNVDGVPIGYYPAALFDPQGLGKSATTIEVGGEIVNADAPGPHTTTGMGSGRPPSDGYGHAAYVRGIQYIDRGHQYRDATSLDTTTPSGTQSVLINPMRDAFWGNASIFFGGPGRVLSNTKLRAASASATVTSELTIAFTIDATMSDDVIVGATLGDSALLADDRKAALTSGSNAVVRTFAVPPTLPPGAYDLTATIWRDLNGNGVIDRTDAILGTVTYANAVTVAPTRKRAAR